MTAKRSSFNAVPVSELVARVVDPVLAKRAGMTTGLLQAWDEIVGDRIASCTRPERIRWARRATAEDPFEPATLIVACEGPAALIVQHMTDRIVDRVNAYLGFAAIGRVRIVQKPVTPQERRPPPRRALRPEEKQHVSARVAAVDDDGLREALARLGESVLAARR